MRLFALAVLAMLAAAPADAQTRADLRGPTGHQRVKLPPGTEGATGGQSRPRQRCRTVIRHGHRVRSCRSAR